MNIITLVSDLGIGGTQRTAQNFATNYLRKGHQSIIITPDKSGVRHSQLISSGVKVFTLDEFIENNNFNYDIVHVHREGCNGGYSDAIVATIKELMPDTHLIETNVFGWSDNTNIGKSFAHHFHVSYWSMWEWLNISKSENRCSVLPNPIDTTVFYSDKDKGESFRKDFGIPLDAFVIGRVGQAIEAKWTPDIVYIFKEIAKMNLDVWLLLVGSPPSILSEIRGLDNSLRNRIILIDRINDDSSLLECYNAMDIFVHSARIGESFGLVIIEAMMCEIPVFSIGNIWRNNAQYEILSSVDDRLYCKNRTELLNNIGSIISDKGEMQRIGSISRKFVLKNYNLLDVTDKALSTFKSIINGEQYINSDARRANILVKECVRSSIKIKAIILSKIMRSNILAKRAIRLIKVLRK